MVPRHDKLIEWGEIVEKKLMELLPYLEPKELIGLATYMKVDKELIKKAVLSSAAGSNDKN